MTEVRRATRDDEAAIVDTVHAAFADDPAWGFMLGAGNASASRAWPSG